MLNLKTLFRSRHRGDGLGGRSVPTIEAIEPRLLYSADAPLLAAATASAPAAAAPAATAPLVPADQSAAAAQSGTGSTPHETTVVDLVVVDARAAHGDGLARQLLDRSQAGAALQWLIVQADDDGFDAVSQALQAFGDAQQDGRSLGAVHLVPDTTDGTPRLGRTDVDIAAVRAHAFDVAQWRSPTGDAATITLHDDGRIGADVIGALQSLSGARIDRETFSGSATTALPASLFVGSDDLSVGIAGIDAGIGGTSATTAATQRELLVIDATAASQRDALERLFGVGSPDVSVDVLVLDSLSAGTRQIADYLAQHGRFDAIRLVSHGDTTGLQLGSQWICEDNIDSLQPDLAAWAPSLSDDADLLFYACDLADSARGAGLLARFAAFTGADIAASTDPTGAADAGGNWVLEYRLGIIQTADVRDATAIAAYQGVLNTYTVTNTNDSGAGSLRQAILDANANAGMDLIRFNISGTGVHTITLSSALPAITGPVVIDGTTDDSFAANGSRPAIVINGNGLNVDGLTLTSTAGGSTIRGMVIRNFASAAISIESGSNGNTIAGNYLGAVTAAGTQGTASSASYTIFIAGSNNIVGGSTAADRNVMGTNGNGGVYGVLVYGASASGNQILGNYIGIGADGSTAFSGTQEGISVSSAVATRIEGNVIAANLDYGVYLGTTGTGTVIHNNLIGTNAAGTALVGAPVNGIWAAQAGASTVITNNVIAGVSQSGIRLDSSASGITVQGNRIGTDAAGTANWGAQRHGIQIASSSNLIGGTGAGQGNIIAFSNQAAGSYDGISVSSGTGTAILGNSIYGTVGTGLGIDLSPDGVTANDVGDADTGANTLQNFPVLTSVGTDGVSVVTVDGTLNSSASSYFRIEFFASPTANASGYGEGRIYLGYVNVNTNTSGDASFSTTLSAAVPAGYAISATATRSVAGFASFSGTSEFAANVTAASVQAVLIVDTAADTLDGDTTSVGTLLASKGGDGRISLREAITAINNTPAGAQPVRVQFAIAGTGTHTITLTSALPSITRPVIIDGTTDDSFAANGSRPAIVLNVNHTGSASDSGLTLTSTAGGSTIRGLVIRGYNLAAITIESGSNGNTIAGNYLGNIDTNGNEIADAPGSYALRVSSSNNVIGGGSAADRNVINNAGYAIYFNGGTGNQVVGNYLGINAAGTAAFANPGNGITETGSAGGNLHANNVIVATTTAIHVNGSGGNDIVRDNLIGIRPDGSGTLGATNAGIEIWSGAHTITGNWIAKTRNGIVLYTSSNIVRSNRIGTDLAGTANWGSGVYGIIVVGGNNNTIGGTGAGQGNVIAFSNQEGNAYDAVSIYSGTGNAILGNSIYGTYAAANALGIDLGTPDGVTANDAGDGDTGANNQQNFPVLTSATTDGAGSVVISGTLNSNASSYYRIEFFASPTANASGYGEGRIYLGYVNVNTNGSGNASFSTTLSAAIPAGYAISATATRSVAGYGTYSDTSEFAKSVVAVSSVQAVLVVDTNADTLDGDTTSLSTLLASKGSDGKISLREAITAINNSPAGAQPTLIQFAIPGTGTHTITLSSALPTITKPVILDASTDDSFAANGSRPAIVLDGNDVTGNGVVLTATASGSTIRGLVIRNFDGAGVLIDAGSDGNTIAGNYIGALTPAGTAAGAGLANSGSGILVFGAGNMLGGVLAVDANVIAGNGQNGIQVTIAGHDNVIQGNRIGTTADGLAALGNHEAGVFVQGANQRILDNLVSGNEHGIVISGEDADGNIMTGNFVGTDITGTAALGNDNDGIQVMDGADGTVVGGFGAGERNLVSGNGQHGVVVAFDSTTGTQVLGNVVGADASGLLALGNGEFGIALYDGASASLISGNLIAGNGKSGIQINGNGNPATRDNRIIGNLIGLDATGTAALGNGQYGIEVIAGARNNQIGDDVPGEGNFVSGNAWGGIYLDTGATSNTIIGNGIGASAEDSIVLGNGGAGVALSSSTGAGNAILGNRIQGSIGLAIDLGDDGPTPNDALDADTGPNELQNTPIIGHAIADGAASRLRGSLSSEPNQHYRIEFFVSSSGDAGVAETMLGFLNVTTNGAGLASFDITTTAIPAGAWISATATKTDAGFTSFGSTSELSAAVQALLPAAPTGTNPILASNEDTTAVISAALFGFSDVNGDAFIGVRIDSLPASGTLLLDGIAVIVGQTISITDIHGAKLRYVPAADANEDNTPLADRQWLFSVQDETGTYAASPNTMTHSILAINDAPVITSNGGGATASVSVAENTTAVTTVAATDVDGPSITYSISGGADAARFQIDPLTGVLSFIAAPDFETPLDADGDNVYHVIVRASDGSLDDTQAIAVTVTDVANVLVVTTADDNNDSGILAGAAYDAEWLNAHQGADSAISLREAIIAANNSSGTTLIRFAIPGTGTHTITLSSALPAITSPVILDASTDDSFAANGSRPAIVLDGSGLQDYGLTLASGASGSTIRGLILRGFTQASLLIDTGSNDNVVAGNYIGMLTPAGGAAGGTQPGDGIVVLGSRNVIGGAAAGDGNVVAGNNVGIRVDGEAADDNVIIGNRIGTDATGTTAIGNWLSGILVRNGADGTVIGGLTAAERNIVSGNVYDGIDISAASTTGTVVRGNHIGVDASGLVALGNGLYGIAVSDGASGSIIGGTSASAGNVISGNGLDGIIIDATATAVAIEHNFIGTNADGLAALANGEFGVRIHGASNVVRNNLISGNASAGVWISGVNAVGNLLAGNGIGIDATGSAALGNGVVGVIVLDGASQTVIGGTTGPDRNVISGNGNSGIQLMDTADARVIGNFIGTDASGMTALGNQFGIVVFLAGSGNQIGGGETGTGNVIAGNAQRGVFIIDTSNHVTVQGNLIGVGFDGATVLGSGDVLIEVNQSSGVLIGTDADGNDDATEGNVIATSASFGSPAIAILLTDADGTVIAGNRIGDASVPASPTSLSHGVLLVDGSHDNRIGGPGAVESNLFIGTSVGGVVLQATAGSGNAILGNRFVDGLGLAIDLGDDGATPNDALDADAGPNDLQNTPVMTYAVADGAGSRVRGSLNAEPNQHYRIEFFASASGDPAAAETLIGYLNVTTDGNGVATFDFVTAPFAAGAWISATATQTDAAFTVFGSTSELSTATQALMPTAPTGGNPILAMTEDQPAVLTAALFGFADANGDTFAAVRIDTLPASGTLTLNGTAVVAGQTIARADLDSAWLVYTPALDANDTNTPLAQRQFTFSVQDDTGAHATAPNTLTFSILAINDAPVITSNGGGATASISVAENTTAVTTVAATDVDGPSITYSISGGADAARFQIDPVTGVLSFIAAPDFETPLDADGDNVYHVIVRASDGSLDDTQAIAVTVTDVSNVLVVTTAADNNDSGILAGAAYDAEWLNAHRGADSAISLREAIIAANNSSGTTLIQFAIPGTGTHTITLSSALPTITSPVILDASTDDSFAANGSRPAIILDVNHVGSASTSGLTLSSTAGGSTIRGLIIQNFNQAAIAISPGSDGNTIAGNYLGNFGADGNEISASPGSYGLLVSGSHNVIGGTTAADRNLINNPGIAVGIDGGTGNQVIGNYIGLNAAGDTAFSDSGTGIADTSGNGGNLFANNAIVSTGSSGIWAYSDAAGHDIIRDNLIGVRPDGSGTIGSTSTGMYVAGGNGHLIIDNWIAASDYGININAAHTVVQGNRIGTDLSGAANWGMMYDGILVQGNDNLIGGTGAGQGNVIAFSNQDGYDFDGIRVAGATGNAILGNRIYGTAGAGLGIDLDPNGVTANDIGDADTGANNLQNFPVLTSATTDGAGSVTISGTLNSNANGYYRIELFASPAAHASGHGEAQTYLGYVNVFTNASGNGWFSTTLSATLPPGYVVTATATLWDLGNGSLSDTSEFAQNIVAASSIQTVLVVDTAADTLDGDVTNVWTLLAGKGSDGRISLREAIAAINNSPAGAQPTLIRFEIPGTGTHTITLTSALPSITRPVILDASTDDSFAANGNRPAIILDVDHVGSATTSGLTLTGTAGGSTIRGLIIQNYHYAAIQIEAGSDGNTIAGNYLGGIDANGNELTLAPGAYAVLVSGSGNVIGGATPADRNVINNASYGVVLYGATSTGNQVIGNHIGLNAAGTAAFPNTEIAVADYGSGGGHLIASNVIVAHTAGVWLQGSASADVVQDNLIGVRPDGGGTFASSGTGVLVSSSAGHTITGNWIAASFYGVFLDFADGIVIQGNRIGTDTTGTLDWGVSYSGIFVTGSGNLIGGTGAGQGNVIAFSNQAGGSSDGITVAIGTGNAILGNRIHGTLAAPNAVSIDLDDDGPTPNDPLDADLGTNDLQNAPVIQYAVADGAGSHVRGVLNTEPNQHYRLEFFASTSGDPSVAETLIGYLNVTTDGNGVATFDFVTAPFAAGAWISATATQTDASFAAFGSTSELSAATQALVPTAPTGGNPILAMTEDQPTVLTAALFGFADANGDAFAAVRIDTLPASGTLTLNGTAVVAGQTIARADLDSAWLVYTPALDANDTNTPLAQRQFTFSVQDDTGAYALSPNTLTFSITAVNDAPVLDGAHPMPTIDAADRDPAGPRIADLLAGHVSDVDGPGTGLAIVAADTAHGTWQFSLDGGLNWQSLGSVDEAAARLLGAEAFLRFVPAGGLDASTAAGLSFVAWDRTSGQSGDVADARVRGGSTAFSTATATSTVQVSYVAPTPTTPTPEPEPTPGPAPLPGPEPIGPIVPEPTPEDGTLLLPPLPDDSGSSSSASAGSSSADDERRSTSGKSSGATSSETDSGGRPIAVPENGAPGAWGRDDATGRARSQFDGQARALAAEGWRLIEPAALKAASDAVSAIRTDGAPFTRRDDLLRLFEILGSHVAQDADPLLRSNGEFRSIDLRSRGDAYDELDAPDSELQRFRVVLNTVEIGGIFASISLIVWIARASTLLGAMWSTMPAWRTFDALVLLARDEDRDDEAMNDSEELAVAAMLDRMDEGTTELGRHDDAPFADADADARHDDLDAASAAASAAQPADPRRRQHFADN